MTDARTPSPPPSGVVGLRAEHRPDAVGVGSRRPRLSWTLATCRRVASVGVRGRGAVGDASAGVGSRRVRRVRARAVAVRPAGARASASPSASALWAPTGPRPSGARPCRSRPGCSTRRLAGTVRRAGVGRGHGRDRSPRPTCGASSTCAARCARARLYVTALGVYEASSTARCVGDHVLAPGWTSYDHRLRYQTFDVTALLRAGRERARRDARRRLVPRPARLRGGRRNLYGDRLALLAQLEVTYADGTTDVVVTDERLAGRRPARSSPPASTTARPTTRGSSAPAGRRPASTTAPGRGVASLERDLATLVAPTGPPVRRIELVAPVAITTLAVGRDDRRLRPEPGRPAAHHGARATAGTTITLRHAEVLEDGELCTRPLRGAAATDRYTLRGGGAETWEPRFTFHGFRYAEVAGWPGELHADDDPRGRLSLRHGAHRLVRVLRPARQPAARERRLEHARQLPRRPDRLPAARRAARLDRRHRSVRADRVLPLRLRRLPHLVARRPGRRAAAGERQRARRRARRRCRSSRPTAARLRSAPPPAGATRP